MIRDKASKRLIHFIMRPDDDTFVLKYIDNLKCSVKPSRAQQELELLLKRNFEKPINLNMINLKLAY